MASPNHVGATVELIPERIRRAVIGNSSQRVGAVVYGIEERQLSARLVGEQNQALIHTKNPPIVGIVWPFPGDILLNAGLGVKPQHDSPSVAAGIVGQAVARNPYIPYVTEFRDVHTAYVEIAKLTLDGEHLRMVG